MTKICFCIPRSCASCYELEASYCPSSITLPVGLAPAATYYMFVRDRFDNIYRDQVTINASGNIEMDLTAYPTGFFAYEMGVIEITLSQFADGTVPITLNTTPSATCISLTVAEAPEGDSSSGCLTADRACTSCYEMSVGFCPDAIELPVGLTPGANYYMFVRDKFDNIYRNLITINADGNIDVDFANYPTGFFSPEMGLIEIFLSASIDGSNPVTLNTSPTSTCIDITVSECVFFADEQECRIFSNESGVLFIAE